MNTDRALNAIGMIMVGALFIGIGLIFFGKDDDSLFTTIARSADGHTVVYDLNDGVGDFEQAVVDYEDNEYVIPNGEPKFASHIFQGWKDKRDDSIYYPGSTITVDEDIVFEAQWKANTHDVTYNLNGGRGNVVGSKVRVGESYVLSDVEPTKDGQHIVGWKSSVNGEVYDVGELVNITGPTRFTAVWEDNVYSVHYDLNGGSKVGDYPDGRVVHGRYYTVSDIKPKNTGVYFQGWLNTYDDTVYDVGTSFRAVDDIKLVAQWSDENYRITYDLDGGIYGGSNQPALVHYGAYGDQHEIATAIPLKSGYFFGGWVNSRNEKVYEIGTKLLVEGDSTMVARWIPSTYKVIYDLNGGSADIQEVDSVDHESTYVVSDVVPKKYGYDFRGWLNTQTNRVVQPGGSIEVTEGLTLKAVWSNTMFTIDFNLNGGTGDFVDQSVGYLYNFHISIAEPVLEGHKFEGWINSRDGKLYRKLDHFEVTGPTTLTAQWDRRDLTIRYDVNKGEGLYADANMTFESDFRISAQIPTRYGYTFNGWVNSVDGKLYEANSMMKVLDNTDLRAEWKLTEYDMTYDLNGGSGAVVDELAEHDSTYQVTTQEAMRDGYKFVGWRDVDSDELYLAGDTILVDRGINFKAEWLLDKRTVAYRLNGGVSTQGQLDEPYLVGINRTYQISGEKPVRNGFTFKNWVDHATGKQYNSGDRLTMGDESIQLDAIWSANEYRVTFDFNGGELPKGSNKSEFNNTVRNYGDMFEISDQQLVKNSQAYSEFEGWRNALDVSGEEPLYKPGDSVEILGDTRLVAVWGYEAFTVQYDEAGGDIVYNNPDHNSPQDVADGTNAYFEATMEYGHRVLDGPTKYGYDFDGWLSDYSDDKYDAGDIIRIPIDMKLTAQWVDARYDLTFDLNGGYSYGSTFDDGIVRHFQPYSIPNTEPVRVGHTFQRWRNTKPGNPYPSGMAGSTYPAGIAHSPGGLIDYPEGPVNLKAEWSVNNYRISFSGGSSSYEPYDSLITIPSGEHRSGYNFNGWRSSSDGMRYGSGYLFRIPARDVTFTPEYSRISYYIRFDANGGSGGSSGYVYHGDSISSPGSPTREGYRFTGWSPSLSGSVYAYSSRTFTAQWEKIEEPEPEKDKK